MNFRIIKKLLSAGFFVFRNKQEFQNLLAFIYRRNICLKIKHPKGNLSFASGYHRDFKTIGYYFFYTGGVLLKQKQLGKIEIYLITFLDKYNNLISGSGTSAYTIVHS